MKRFLLSAFTLLLLVACSIDSPIPDDGPSESLEGTWQLIRFEDDVDHTVTEAPEDSEITVIFTDFDFTGVRKASQFGGKYVVTDRNRLSVMDFFDSKAEESAEESEFYAATKEGFNSQDLSYEISGGMLWVKYDDLKFMVLQKK